MPAAGWMPTYDGGGQVRDSAWVADITGVLDLEGWPARMRVIVRKERRIRARGCGSPTSTGTGSPPSPPTPARASSPTWNCATGAGHAAKATSFPRQGHRLPNLPLKGLAQNQVWCEIVALACDSISLPGPLANTLTATSPGGGRRQPRSNPRLQESDHRRILGQQATLPPSGA